MRINAIVAARMTSTRLPGKVLMDLAGKASLLQQIERLKQSKYLNDIIIATTTNDEDDLVVEMAQSNYIKYYRGSEEDVLKRTVEAAEKFDTDFIVQITGDCPLIDSETIDRVIERMLYNPYLDYVSNQLINTYPLGFSVEIFRTEDLRRVEERVNDSAVREHVSLYFYEHPETYKLSNVEAPFFLRHPDYRLTLDTKADYEVISTIYKELYLFKPNFNLYDIIRYLETNQKLLERNSHVQQKSTR